MTTVNVTTTTNTVTVSEDGGTIVVTTDQISQSTFDALQARVAALEALDILLLEG